MANVSDTGGQKTSCVIWHTRRESCADRTVHEPANMRMIHPRDLEGCSMEVIEVQTNKKHSYRNHTVWRTYMVVAFGPNDYAFLWIE